MVEQIKTGYKIVRAIEDRYYSTFSVSGYLSRFEDAVVEYKIGEFVGPNEGCGPLCVLSGPLSVVSDFISIYYRCPMPRLMFAFECEYIESTLEYIWRKNNRRSNDDSKMMKYDLPCHTILADKVKLTKKVLRLKEWCYNE